MSALTRFYCILNDQVSLEFFKYSLLENSACLEKIFLQLNVLKSFVNWLHKNNYFLEHFHWLFLMMSTTSTRKWLRRINKCAYNIHPDTSSWENLLAINEKINTKLTDGWDKISCELCISFFLNRYEIRLYS